MLRPGRYQRPMPPLTSPQVISFDCAQTLLWVDWDPVRLACQSATDMGFGGDSRAAEIYGRLLKTRWAEYLTLNEAADEDATDAWWARLGQDWVSEVGWPEDAASIIAQRATAKLYGPNADVFGLFPDTLPTLQALKERGVRMAVVSVSSESRVGRPVSTSASTPKAITVGKPSRVFLGCPLTYLKL